MQTRTNALGTRWTMLCRKSIGGFSSDQYNDIAKFFNGWDWGNRGKPSYGSCEVMARSDGRLQWFTQSRTAAYAKHPDDPLTRRTPTFRTLID